MLRFFPATTLYNLLNPVSRTLKSCFSNQTASFLLVRTSFLETSMIPTQIALHDIRVYACAPGRGSGTQQHLSDLWDEGVLLWVVDFPRQPGREERWTSLLQPVCELSHKGRKRRWVQKGRASQSGLDQQVGAKEPHGCFISLRLVDFYENSPAVMDMRVVGLPSLGCVSDML